MEMKDFSLEGKVALVTGASYGIGLPSRKAWRRRARLIVFNDIRQELVDKGPCGIQGREGVEAHGYVCDVTDEDAVQAMVKQIAPGSGRRRHSGEQRGHHQAHPDVRDDGNAVPAGGGRGPERAVHREQGSDQGMIERARKIINICSMMSELGRETVSAYAAKGRPEDADEEHCQQYGEYNISATASGRDTSRDAADGAAAERQADGSRHPFDQFIIAKTPAAALGEPRRTLGRRCPASGNFQLATAMCCMWTAASSPPSASSRNEDNKIIIELFGKSTLPLND